MSFSAPPFLLNVRIGNQLLVVPVRDGTQTLGWLQGEIIRRWKKKTLENIQILELRTAENAHLDTEDQIFEVFKDGDTVVCTTVC